jgi:hypothetical protein
MRRLLLLIVLAGGSVAAPPTTTRSALAGPPSYLLLRRSESPGPHGHPGYPAAEYYDARTHGYAYGYFGVAPRNHWSRHFGINRMYTQWSQW